MQGFDNLYYPSSAGSSSLSSTLLDTYMHTSQRSFFEGDLEDGYHASGGQYYPTWRMHYSQPRSMIPTSQMRSSAGEYSYSRGPALGMIQQPQSDGPPLPSLAVENSFMPTITDMIYSPTFTDTFLSDEAEMDNNMSAHLGSSPHINPSPSLSSDSTSSPSPSLPSPGAAAQQPLIIYQPRPYRRIPIISLSQLASACEDPESRPPQQTALSPLPFEYLDFASEVHQPPVQYSFPPLASFNACKLPAAITKTGDMTIFCPCGCMEHYIHS
ncbi:hypothetical protein AX15_004013 [Amanita polypyramis BW_CC]|nr:hypothetical protein AX15_004013 [Amanita polypyramis BW_CC]